MHVANPSLLSADSFFPSHAVLGRQTTPHPLERTLNESCECLKATILRTGAELQNGLISLGGIYLFARQLLCFLSNLAVHQYRADRPFGLQERTERKIKLVTAAVGLLLLAALLLVGLWAVVGKANHAWALWGYIVCIASALRLILISGGFRMQAARPPAPRCSCALASRSGCGVVFLHIGQLVPSGGGSTEGRKTLV